jgi:hypothetical protein
MKMDPFPRASTATYVRKPDGWYATWPCGRYTAALGPFRFRWLARRSVARSIQP